MKTLVEILKIETEKQRVEYLAKVATQSANTFAKMVENRSLPISAWYDRFEVKYTMVDPPAYSKNRDQVVKVDSKEYHQKRYYKCSNQMVLERRIVEDGIEKYLAKCNDKAELHYQNSIEKLAARIEAKGLNQETLKVNSGYVGVNFEINLTDGIKTVKAFTIIAEGEIQQAHYRYLIK